LSVEAGNLVPAAVRLEEHRGDSDLAELDLCDEEEHDLVAA